MCPCSIDDISFPIPTVPSGPQIPGFGIPFQLPTKQIPIPPGFPEDLLDILDKLQLLIPPGALKPALNPNFGKDIFDGIMKLLDQFMPFLMLYKFFLPVLHLIICIIEVLCALMNPFALASALNKLFTQCIPEFLNLFPIFALILMIISLLLLLLALIEYIIEQIIKFIAAILRNLNALIKAFQSANATSVAAIAHKLGALLCIFQNLFVLLALFGIIIQIIKDILSLVFSIPPCEGGGPGSTDGCCAATYCPTIVQNQYTNTTGILQYLPESGIQTNISLPVGNFNVDLRTESWQLYDPDQSIGQAFWNIVDGYDISPTVVPKPVFFPTDAVYSAITAPQQAAYTVDLRLFYNPAAWGRSGVPQYIQFKDCIVLFAPTQNLETYNNGEAIVPSGVLFIAGGLGYLDNGVDKLAGFAVDGVTPIDNQATLNNFLHMAPQFSTNPVLSPSDGYTFFDMQYTFKPNLNVLLQKNLITLGCEPQVALARAFMSNVMFSQVAAQTADLSAIVNGLNGNTFPDPAAAEQCLLTAVTNLRTNMTVAGVAEFQTTSTLCLNKLQNDTKQALASVVGVGFNPCQSNFSLNPAIQFTTQPITVSVNLNENNGLPLTAGLPVDVASSLALDIKGYPTFGDISNFNYDGYQAFTAQITSDTPGQGEIMVSFKNQILCTNTLPTDGSSPTHTLQKLDYQFVYAPQVSSNIPSTLPRRDGGDVARDSKDDNS